MKKIDINSKLIISPKPAGEKKAKNDSVNIKSMKIEEYMRPMIAIIVMPKGLLVLN
jgi:hypothetical protein